MNLQLLGEVFGPMSATANDAFSQMFYNYASNPPMEETTAAMGQEAAIRTIFRPTSVRAEN